MPAKIHTKGRSMRILTILLTLMLLTPLATAQDAPVCDLTTAEAADALETLDTYQEQLEELQIRLERFVELQNAPAATRLMEWAVFADYRQFASADTLPACGNYAAALTAYRDAIQHVYALSAQLQVGFNTSMDSIQSMTQELLAVRLTALTEALQTWVDAYQPLTE